MKPHCQEINDAISEDDRYIQRCRDEDYARDSAGGLLIMTILVAAIAMIGFAAGVALSMWVMM